MSESAPTSTPAKSESFRPNWLLIANQTAHRGASLALIFLILHFALARAALHPQFLIATILCGEFSIATAALEIQLRRVRTEKARDPLSTLIFASIITLAAFILLIGSARSPKVPAAPPATSPVQLQTSMATDIRQDSSLH